MDPERRLDRVRLLVVDDHADSREAVSEFMAWHGADVVCAESAAVALDLLSTRPVDVMVLDLDMPGMHGFELIWRIRKTGNIVPAIAFSALDDVAVREQAMEAGFQMFVPKPLEPLRLLRGIERLAAPPAS